MRTELRRGRGQKRYIVLAGIFLLSTVLMGAALTSRAEKAAPEGSSLRREKPAQQAVFPLGTAEWRVSDAYGWRTDPITGQEKFHEGTDLACAEGTPVLAAMDGVVSDARRSASYGSCVRLRHSGGQETLYAHLQYSFVREGEVVQMGQMLGTAGDTGRSTGVHLHIELLKDDVRCDPGALLSLP